MEDVEGFTPPDHGYLVGWAVQGTVHTCTCGSCLYIVSHYSGVLLLNACLTVREQVPNSHAGKVRAQYIQCYSFTAACVHMYVGLGETDRRCDSLAQRTLHRNSVSAVGMLCTEEGLLHQPGIQYIYIMHS